MTNYSSLIRSLATVALAAVCALFSSCRQDGPDEHTIVFNDVVELASVDNGQTVFHLYTPDADEPAVLTAGQQFVDTAKVHLGESLILAYSTPDNRTFKHCRITPYSYAAITNLKLMQADQDGLNDWDKDPVYVHSVWRAGQRVNLRVTLVYYDKTRHFGVILDKSTQNDEYPTAYLYNAADFGKPNFQREYYISCDLSALFARPAVKGLKLVISNSNTPSGTPADNVYTILNPNF